MKTPFLLMNLIVAKRWEFNEGTLNNELQGCFRWYTGPPIPTLYKDRYFVRSRTLVFYEYGKDEKLSQDDFMDIFWTGGSLGYLKDNIYEWTSPGKGVYNVTFKAMTDAVRKVENNLLEPKALRTCEGKRVMVKCSTPWKPSYQITLRGVPAEYDLILLKTDICRLNWGQVHSCNPGYHKKASKWGSVRNNYVHLRLTDLKPENIPGVFKLAGHEVYVTKPGEEVRQVCSYCKKFWHLEETCWTKLNDLQKEQEAEKERQAKQLAQQKAAEAEKQAQQDAADAETEQAVASIAQVKDADAFTDYHASSGTDLTGGTEGGKHPSSSTDKDVVVANVTLPSISLASSSTSITSKTTSSSNVTNTNSLNTSLNTTVPSPSNASVSAPSASSNSLLIATAAKEAGCYPSTAASLTCTTVSSSLPATPISSIDWSQQDEKELNFNFSDTKEFPDFDRPVLVAQRTSSKRKSKENSTPGTPPSSKKVSAISEQQQIVPPSEQVTEIMNPPTSEPHQASTAALISSSSPPLPNTSESMDTSQDLKQPVSTSNNNDYTKNNGSANVPPLEEWLPYHTTC